MRKRSLRCLPMLRYGIALSLLDLTHATRPRRPGKSLGVTWTITFLLQTILQGAGGMSSESASKYMEQALESAKTLPSLYAGEEWKSLAHVLKSAGEGSRSRRGGATRCVQKADSRNLESPAPNFCVGMGGRVVASSHPARPVRSASEYWW